jgi:hypothetical protein
MKEKGRGCVQAAAVSSAGGGTAERGLVTKLNNDYK